MDYYETRGSLIFYLYRMVDNDSWRVDVGLDKFKIISDLYTILLDVLSEFVNVRYGNLCYANEDDVSRVIMEDYPPAFKDDKAMRYIRFTYFLYMNLNCERWLMPENICKVIREGKYVS